MPTTEVLLSEEQSKELRSIAQSRSLPAGYVFRARLILMLAEGATFSMIQKQLRTTAPTIIRWKGALPSVGDGWTGYASSRPISQRADGGLAGEDSVGNA
jgi:hypothetical protein